MKTRQLGKNGPKVTEIGLGCMPMVEFYGTTTGDAALNTMRRTIELGVNYIDTADMYGRGKGEELLSQIIKTQRDKLVIATKFGFVRKDANLSNMTLNGSPAYVKEACEASLHRLKIDYIDLYYLHRVDPNVPVEETVSAMKELVNEGKVRYLGLSGTNAEMLKRAATVHPIHAYQDEYSLWNRDPETNGLLKLCQELEIAFVPYSPLGRGFLSGKIRSFDKIPSDDFRKILPRFQAENLEKNLLRLAQVEAVAKRKGCTPAQLALAWLLAQDSMIAPIPGARTPEQIEEACGAVNVTLIQGDLDELDSIMPIGCAVGAPYPNTMKAK